MMTLLYIIFQIIKTIAIINLVNSLYDYFFKEDKKDEDHNFRSK
jgi:hypothetical protein